MSAEARDLGPGSSPEAVMRTTFTVGCWTCSRES